ncbi:MAG: ribonuclease P protein component [Hyphomicrobiaceae bacterium]|nr:ribonuclease P protein component [Hyphomicrobiaceae bacterium]
MDRLKKRAEFLAVAKGPRASRRAFTLQARRTAADRRSGQPEADPAPVAPPAPRVGFTVTKREGTAVERNRIRRRLRAVVAGLAADVATPGWDYVLVGRREALHHDFTALIDDVVGAFSHVHKAQASSSRSDKGQGGRGDRPRRDR